jgi:hypothetical protein
VWQKSPGAAAADDVEDGVEDLVQGVDPWASGSSWGGEVGLYASPLGVGEISLVCSSHVRHPTGPMPHNPFSDSFTTQFVNKALLVCLLILRWRRIGAQPQ